jgi:thiamine-monophosphate kinase
MPSEFELIARHFARPAPGAVLGPGDDCAIVAPTPGCELCITTDMLAEGTHFLPGTDPQRLGWKTLAVNLSDLAAMGARPRWVLLAGCLPDADEAWIAAFARGFFELAKAADVDVIGGDTTRGPRNLCVTAIGEVARGTALRRDGARIGDDLWVSGRPGLAALGLADRQGRLALPARIRKDCLDALEQPLPRLALGRALVGVASAAIDVSDGLLGDLQHILERSSLSALVETARLPALPGGVDADIARRAQLAGGDDYELVFAATADRRREIEEIADRVGVAATRFGTCTPFVPDAPRLDLRAPDGAPLTIEFTGYDHFH